MHYKKQKLFIKYKKVRKMEEIREKPLKVFLIKKICSFLKVFKFVIKSYTQIVSSL